MAFSIEKWKMEEKIRLALLKHRGMVLSVAKELNLDVEYVNKIYRKFQKSMQRDTSLLVSNTIMQMVMSGYQSRVAHLMGILDDVKDRKQLEASICCQAPFKIEEDGTKMCLKCHMKCSTTLIDRGQIFDLALNAIRELRKEDQALIEFSDIMGYTNRPEPQAPQAVLRMQQNIIAVGGSLGEKETALLKDAANLKPMDRERLIRNLEQQMLNGGSEDGEESTEDKQV